MVTGKFIVTRMHRKTFEGRQGETIRARDMKQASMMVKDRWMKGVAFGTSKTLVPNSRAWFKTCQNAIWPESLLWGLVTTMQYTPPLYMRLKCVKHPYQIKKTTLRANESTEPLDAISLYLVKSELVQVGSSHHQCWSQACLRQRLV